MTSTSIQVFGGWYCKLLSQSYNRGRIRRLKSLAEGGGDAKQVRAYLGLVPKEDSSGEKRHRGKVTKAGNSRARRVLVEAAWVLLRTEKPETEALRRWALGIAQRRGKRIAAVALARRLGGILYALWRDGTRFDPEAVAGAGTIAGRPQAA
jgi:transposase